MKILVINTRKGMGDQIIFLPYIHAISRKFKTAVSLLAKDNSRAMDLFEEDNHVNEVIILENRTVGPSLGQDSINKGITSIIYGGLVVEAFIAVYYKLSGIIAVIALFLNIVLLAGALAYFGAALTLPGIAGIILTVGMAIDANVLVFERIREELRIGKTVRAAIDAGFSKAFRTIVDANITSFIAAVVLFQFGTGPIKGFAITLCIGIAASMFTAVFVSRTIFDGTMSQRKLDKFSI